MSSRDVARVFERRFGRAPETAAHAPGRVNLIGEHTDYNGGFVLPTAIPQRTHVAIARRADRTVHAATDDIAGAAAVVFALGDETRGRGWVDYVQGTVVALRRAGHDVGGFDVAIVSDVPIGAGLSSSAALDVALLRGLRALFGVPIGDVDLAMVARAAETEFVGAPVGIMDPMAASLADQGSALLLDTRSLVFERIALPSALEIVVVDSGSRHGHATGDYARRRAECEQAAEMLGVPMLRDETDPDRAGALPDPFGRRARHVVTENARVLAAAEHLRRGDIEPLGALLDASHASLRSDFEVSVPEVDLLVAIAQADPDTIGARMTGGGFGGAIVALARAGRGRDVAQRVVRAYGPAGRALVPETKT